jgi:hypothetical protein
MKGSEGRASAAFILYCCSQIRRLMGIVLGASVPVPERIKEGRQANGKFGVE